MNKIDIDKKSPIPRYYQLAAFLKEAISKSIFAEGSLLPSERCLMSQYNLSRSTVRQALGTLEEEGFLLREQGKGTVVIASEKKLTNHQMVALMIPSHGHLFEQFSRQMIRSLQERGYYPVVTDIVKLKTETTAITEKINQLIRFNPRGMVVDGFSYFPFNYLRAKGFENIVFTLHFESPDEFPEARFILTDYEYGGYLGTKYLLELGHRKILFFTHRLKNESYFSLQNFFQGCKKALEEAGTGSIDSNLSIMVDEDNESSRDKLLKILSQPDRPTAIFTSGDFRVQVIYEAAHDLNIKIPRDLSVLGYYNTPWCNIFKPKLTSISVKEMEIARLTAKAIIRPEDVSGLKKKVMIRPELIIRESTGKI